MLRWSVGRSFGMLKTHSAAAIPLEHRWLARAATLQFGGLGGAHYSVAIIIKLHAPLGFRTRVCGIGQYFKGVLPAIPQTENRRFAIKSPTENTHFGGYFNQNNAYRGIDIVCWLFLNRKSTTLRQTANQQ